MVLVFWLSKTTKTELLWFLILAIENKTTIRISTVRYRDFVRHSHDDFVREPLKFSIFFFFFRFSLSV